METRKILILSLVSWHRVQLYDDRLWGALLIYSSSYISHNEYFKDIYVSYGIDIK